MPTISRVLPEVPITSLAEHLAAGGGAGLEAARKVEPEALIGELEASGLRGRGGAGFPTGTKWRTVRDNAAADLSTSVVVNAAEGEPGTFKDRAILRANPFAVLEGALIAARAVGATEIIVALKESFADVVGRVRAAVVEIEAAGWCDGIAVRIHEGPDEYLYGEETALLESVDGRAPLPRLAPPYRRGVTEVVTTHEAAASGSGLSGQVELAGPGGEVAPPALVDNVETLANVAGIMAHGAPWFREVGTADSPGTIVCTVSGATQVAGVAEFAMGTSLREVIDTIGGGLGKGRRLAAVLTGVSGAAVLPDQLDTPLTYEDMAAIGSGLGSAGFIVVDNAIDLMAVAAGASRFLAVESCGQCTPCKQDGLAVAELLDSLCKGDTDAAALASVDDHLRTITDGARCSLAAQHETVVRSLLAGVAVDTPVRVRAVEPLLVAELLDIADGVATWDEHHREKQPDWSYEAEDSGKSPADRLGEHRVDQSLPS